MSLWSLVWGLVSVGGLTLVAVATDMTPPPLDMTPPPLDMTPPPPDTAPLLEEEDCTKLTVLVRGQDHQCPFVYTRLKVGADYYPRSLCTAEDASPCTEGDTCQQHGACQIGCETLQRNVTVFRRYLTPAGMPLYQPQQREIPVARFCPDRSL